MPRQPSRARNRKEPSVAATLLCNEADKHHAAVRACAIGGRQTAGDEVECHQRAKPELGMLGYVPIVDSAKRELARGLNARCWEQLVAVDGFGAREDGPRVIRLVFRLCKEAVLVRA